MNFKENRVMFADSYKYGQPPQYPEGTVGMFDYLESRGGLYDETFFVGLQMLMIKYFNKPIKMWEVKEARDYAEAHGIAFDYKGWKRIVKKHNGYLPVKIRAVKEGSVVPVHNVLVTIESTDKKLPWVPGWLETFLMKVWYPITVASKTKSMLDMLNDYADQYSDSRAAVPFQFHNFGDRATTCPEQAAIGGVAHLAAGSLGTDNFNCLRYAHKFYKAPIAAAYSINAGEHSTVTSWGAENEFERYMHQIETFKDDPLVADVLDSTNIYRATDYVTSGKFKAKIESDDYPKYIMRPDSGNPVEIVQAMLKICTENGVKYTLNSKGLKVMTNYGIIYGDGINKQTTAQILDAIILEGYAPENLAFGSGGDLMQMVNRDTNKFAIKCSAIDIVEPVTPEKPYGKIITRDVFKDPITDPGKKSKAGKLELIKRDGKIMTVKREEVLESDTMLLEDFWRNGYFFNFQKWEDIVAH